jgi:hypothetical protein
VCPGVKSTHRPAMFVARFVTRQAQTRLERALSPRLSPPPTGFVFATVSVYFALTPRVLREPRSLRTAEFDRFMRSTFAADENHSLAASSAWADVVYPDGPESISEFAEQRLEILHAIDPILSKYYAAADLPYPEPGREIVCAPGEPPVQCRPSRRPRRAVIPPIARLARGPCTGPTRSRAPGGTAPRRPLP